METAAFDYDLPVERIAQVPLAERDASLLLVDRGPGREPDDRVVRDLPELLEPGDLVVVNRSRVLPARLAMHKSTGGRVEVLLLEALAGASVADRGPQRWAALVRPGRRVPPGTVVASTVDDELLTAEVGRDLGEGRREVTLQPRPGPTLIEVLERCGEVPLPPYITHALADPERYQTLFAGRAEPDEATSVAAPTAGLHLTQRVLDGLAGRGVEVVSLTLDVGLGTFRPISSQRVEDHVMHAEGYRVDPATWKAVQEAERVVAVGTTTVRALESAAATGELAGRTELFIHAGFEFQVVDRLLTNFHMPRSSLLVMIDAFAGPQWRRLYEHALAGSYRFLSFGDAMLLTRHDRWPSVSERRSDA